MSLTRYENEEIIVQLNEPQYGQVFTSEDLKLFPSLYLVPDDPNFIRSNIAQIHIYSFYGDYIAGDHNASYLIHDPYTNSLLINVADTFREANIRRGSYIIVTNLFEEIWGSPDRSVVYVREVSPDRTEVKLTVPSSLISEVGNFKTILESLGANGILNNLIIDFGFNRVSKIVKVKFDANDPSIIYLKLYKPLSDEIEDKSTAWFGFETMDSYVDTVILTSPIEVGETYTMRGANYDIDTSEWASNSTVFKSWNDLLDSDADTSQRIVDMSLSGSGVTLNIDYTDFNNFIHYSSAEERIKNFRYKLGLIETYNQNVATLQESTASITTYVSSSVATNTNRINSLKSTFDPFERWLYYSGTGSLFTHDISGSIKPYPKYLSGGKYNLYHTTSSRGVSWYNGLISSASVYDQQNPNRLWWTIPEHILMDDGNSDYVLFVDMVGQHFDNLYSYTRALTQIHERDEHPERGVSNDLLYNVAKSFGWNLQNTRQLSDLWFYKLGTNSSGQYEHTGSMFSLSRENQTQQIWRRIVNNLPYFLKTKGTSRSIKAMMAVYGIPHTILSIKEYGGASQENDKPQWIEDRYSYALNFAGTQSIRIPRSKKRVKTKVVTSTFYPYVPDIYEFRFSTTYTGSGTMTLFNVEYVSSSNALVSGIELRLEPASVVFGTASVSGSRSYGRLQLLGYNTSFYTVNTTYSPYMPFFDGDMWTVNLGFPSNPISGSNNGGVRVLRLAIAKASDCFGGVASMSMQPFSRTLSPNNEFLYWSAEYASGSRFYTRLGGTDATHGITEKYASTSSFFSGSMQHYREYYRNAPNVLISTEEFKEHVLNPGAYNVFDVTGSFNDLYRYFPLGGDAIRYDHGLVGYVTSSQPNRRIFSESFNAYATFSNFGLLGGQEDQYRSFSERNYIYTPSIGGNNIRNQKIRLETSSLLHQLSPTARGERSQYDRAPLDTNRLAIVFSQADQINRDIFNQFGFTELDKYIGDPQFEFDSDYSELKQFSYHYFKKYNQKPDINAFIRILSVYDYSFFEQIKQLIPGRANLISGILIEPSILERSKVQLTKRPVISNPQWEQTIQPISNVLSGDSVPYNAILSSSMDVEFEYTTYSTASIPDPIEFEIGSIHHVDAEHQNTGICGTIDFIPTRYSGSQCPTQSIITHQYINTACKYKLVEFHYSASGVFETRYKRQWYAAVSKSYGMYYSKSLHSTGYQIDECGSRNNSRFRGSKLEGAGFNIDSPNTVDGGPVVVIIESNPNRIFLKGDSSDGNLLVE